MFNLEESIAEWRKQMLAAGIETPVPLEELESHLREEIERQTESGLSEMEAFKASVQKIGPAQAVQNEFGKVEAIKEDRLWQHVEIMLVASTGLVPIFFASAGFSKHGVYWEMTPGQLIVALAAVAAFSLLAWSGRLSYRLFPVIPTKRARDAIHLIYIAPTALWWLAFLCLILPHYDFTVGQLFVTLLWALLPSMGACIGLFWGIETAVRKKEVPTRS
ncbi:MAG: permease prefix domain 1-containing protein [Limisphaerales bacterium]